jgi:hypothetical protein
MGGLFEKYASQNASFFVVNNQLVTALIPGGNLS